MEERDIQKSDNFGKNVKNENFGTFFLQKSWRMRHSKR